MHYNMKILFATILIFFFICESKSNAKLLDTSNALLSRQRRYLIWNEGINWVQMIAGIGLPIELEDQSITLGAVIKAFYLLPTNSSSYTHPSIDYARKKRSTTRWIIYEMIEMFLKRYGVGDAKACLLKAICETASIPFEKRSGILAEIVHALLTPSSTLEVLKHHLNMDYHSAEKLGKEVDSCDIIYPECKNNILSQFTRFLT